MDVETRKKRLKFRAWHRGTKEADMMLGGFFEAYGNSWDQAQLDWFEALLDEQDVDIMAWAIGTQAVPDQWQSPIMDQLRKLDFIQTAR